MDTLFGNKQDILQNILILLLLEKICKLKANRHIIPTEDYYMRDIDLHNYSLYI